MVCHSEMVAYNSAKARHSQVVDEGFARIIKSLVRRHPAAVKPR
jgi:hypothetical protein